MSNSVVMKEESYQAFMAGSAGFITKYMIVVWVISALFFNLSIVGHKPDYSKLSSDIAQEMILMMPNLDHSRVESLSNLVGLDNVQMSLCNFEQLHYPTIKDVKTVSESCSEIINRRYRMYNEVEGALKNDETDSKVNDFLGDLGELIVSADLLNRVALRTNSDSTAQIEFFIQQYLVEQHAPTPIADLFGFQISQTPYLYLTALLIVTIICMQYQFKKINLVWCKDWRINSQSEVFSDSKLLFFLYYKFPLMYSTSMAIALPIIHNFYLPREIHLTPPPGIKIEDYYYQTDVWSYFEVMLAVLSLLAMYKLFVYMNELQNRVQQIRRDI